MRCLNQMSRLWQIFYCFSFRFGKVIFNLKRSNFSDSDVTSHLQLQCNSWVKFGICEIQRLNLALVMCMIIVYSNVWLMVTGGWEKRNKKKQLKMQQRRKRNNQNWREKSRFHSTHIRTGEYETLINCLELILLSNIACVAGVERSRG